jgi:hypothetical protein
MQYKIWSIKNYGIANHDFIEKKSIEYDDINELCNDLENDGNYHFRINNNNEYIFFGDIDGYKNSIKNFIIDLQDFLKTRYGLLFEKKDFLYTVNDEKIGSYHYSITKWHCSIIKIKEIHTKFWEEKRNDKFYCYKDDDSKLVKVIDTTIYSDKWFRCPNQSKGNNKKGIHKIKKGKMKDFIIDYIPKKSININDIKFIDNIKKKKDDDKKELIIEKVKDKKEPVIKKDDINNNLKIKKIEIIKKLLKLLDNEFYDIYEFWYRIGMILKKISVTYDYNFFDDFDEFSKRSKKYDQDNTLKMWNNFNVKNITINDNSLYKYARDCNIGEYKLIMKELNECVKIEVSEKFIINKLHELVGHRFIFYNDKIICYSKNRKMWFETDEILKKYINEDLYDYLYILLNDSISDESYLKNQIRELKNNCLKIVKLEQLVKHYIMTYKYSNSNQIKFNEKYYLFGFTNGVYDFLKREFRDYRYDDYITINCGYDYKKTTDTDKEKIINIIKQIMPIDDECHLLLQILASCLIGKPYEKFIIFNGHGRNGKSVLTSFMNSVLGDGYFAKLKNEYLTGDLKVGNGINVDISDLSYKRYINLTEPAENKKIENSFYKSLTGGEQLRARTLLSKENKVIIHGTCILECNKKPTLKEQPTDADIMRIIDLNFGSKFTENNEEIDEINNIYKCDSSLKNPEYLEYAKHAIFEILSEYAYKFLTEEKEIFLIPNSIKQRTQQYLNKSYLYLEYLDEMADKTDNKDNFISMHELYEKIKQTDKYINETKENRRKITKQSIIDFFSKHQETKKIYKDVYQFRVDGKNKKYNNVLQYYKFIVDKDNENLND